MSSAEQVIAVEYSHSPVGSDEGTSSSSSDSTDSENESVPTVTWQTPAPVPMSYPPMVQTYPYGAAIVPGFYRHHRKGKHLGKRHGHQYKRNQEHLHSGDGGHYTAHGKHLRDHSPTEQGHTSRRHGAEVHQRHYHGGQGHGYDKKAQKVHGKGQRRHGRRSHSRRRNAGSCDEDSDIHLRCDVSSFTRKEVKVTVSGNDIIVKAVSGDNDSGTSQEMTCKFSIKKEYDVTKVRSWISRAGILKLVVPLKDASKEKEVNKEP